MDNEKILESIIDHPERDMIDHYNAGADQCTVDLFEAASALESTDRLMKTNKEFTEEVAREERRYRTGIITSQEER